MSDITRIRFTQWYKEYFPEEYENYKKGKYPIYDFYNSGYSVTWCPVCELQRYVSSINFDWWHCEICDCTFTKVNSIEKHG